MDGGNRTRARLVAVLVLGIVLLLPPVLLVFNHPVRGFGIPALYLYIFAVWALIIVLAAAIAAHMPADEPGGHAREGERATAGGEPDA